MNRPLGTLSDFVVERLPHLLATAPENIPGESKRLLAHLPEKDPSDIGRLDLKMLEAAIVHSGLLPPAELSGLIDRLSGNELPMLSYEELVLVNPMDDPRAFTLGEIRETEIAFYEAHRQIEGWLDQALEKCGAALEALNWNMALARHPDPKQAALELQGIQACLDPVVETAARLGRMPPGHFAAFRKYLATSPARGLKGPSGAFTAGIPLLDLILHGDALPLDFFGYLEQNLGYFPRRGRTLLRFRMAQAREGQTLSALAKRRGDPPEIQAGLQALRDFLLNFRRAHLRAVAQQIPEVLRGDAAGTGGESEVRAFLGERIQMTKERR